MSIAMVMRYRIDMDGPLKEIPTQTLLVEGDKAANEIRVEVTNRGAPADLTGCKATAYFVRQTGEKVKITGAVEGSTINVVLTENCYYVPGTYAFVLSLQKDDAVRTVLWLTGRLITMGDGGIVDPESTVPSIAQLEQYIEAMAKAIENAEAATEAASRVANMTVTATTLPTGQPATASYKDGVLTLGLPKGETGSASPIKVNGVEAVGSNITLTAENIPMGDGSVAEKVRMAGAYNLLDNGDFRINQRGESSYTVNGYTVDRWRTKSATAAVTVNSEGITPGVPLRQYVDGDTSGALTLAVCDGDGVVHVASGNLADGAIVGDTMQLDTDDTGVYFLLSAGKTYRWAALYRGEYTADTMPEFVPKGYAAELLACQRYYIRVKTFQVAGQTFTTGARFGFALPMPMRITPTMTLLENGTIICNGVKDVAVTGGTVVGILGNRIKISTEHASQSGWSLQTGTWLNGEFELSADL